MGKLTALKVDKTKTPGLTGDGDGLYLRVTPTGAKMWQFRFQRAGRSRAMGMGAYPLSASQTPVSWPRTSGS